jgi:hypothetical protein
MNDLPAAAQQLKALSPQLVILMGSTERLQDAAAFKQLAETLPDAQIVGCSTSGEIDAKGVSDKGLVIAAAHFDHSKIRTISHELTSSAASYDAGTSIAKSMLGEDLKGVFILAPGININGSELVRGFRDVLPSDVTLTGGLAGDGTRFQETRTTLNGELFKSHVVAVGFYGKDLSVSAGSKGGWKPFGPSRRVTKSEGNILFELDGKPALQLYKDYLGEKAADLPASGLLYPLAILRGDRSTTGLIRTILNVDHEAQSLILAGDLPVDSMVCLMHADPDLLAAGSAAAATEALGASPTNEGDTLSIFISCVGRRLVMGEDTDEEIETALNVLGKNTKMCGFYSYGEIAPFDETSKPELHNQTMTITHIRERSAA